MFKAPLSKVMLVLGLIAAASGCTNKNNGAPRNTLSDYVNRSMRVKTVADKKELSALTTGQAKAAIEAMDDATFKSYFLDQQREFLSLKVRDERELSQGQYSITYELSYKSKSPNSDDLVTIKKHALLVKEKPDGPWMISEVQNLKTNIEHQNAMSF